jgi:hypothetical protein
MIMVIPIAMGGVTTVIERIDVAIVMAIIVATGIDAITMVIDIVIAVTTVGIEGRSHDEQA